MPRQRIQSKIQVPPRARGFAPMGSYKHNNEHISMHIEEYEAIRLLDYENLTQSEAARIMGISRPSLTRIYKRARGKIATLITEARPMFIEGGNAFFDSEWICCERCDSRFNTPRKNTHRACPLCNSENIFHL